MISSMPMFVLFLSPPEIPRVICVPTWGTKKTNNKTQRGSLKIRFTYLLEDRWVTGCDYLQHLGVSHFGETQFFNEVTDSSLLLDLRHGDVQSQSRRKTQILPHGQGAHDHIFLVGRRKLDQRSQTEKLFCSYHFHKSLMETTTNKTLFRTLPHSKKQEWTSAGFAGFSGRSKLACLSSLRTLAQNISHLKSFFLKEV